jgi:predicted nucleic acid-binding protein
VNLLIDFSVFITAGRFRPYRRLLDEAIRQRQLLLSSVVAMELYAGFKSQEGRRTFTALHRALQQAGKIVVPSHDDFLLAGRTLFHLSKEFGALNLKDHFRDGLIAVSASRIGAMVVTENSRNFELWRDGLARSGRRLNRTTQDWHTRLSP